MKTFPENGKVFYFNEEIKNMRKKPRAGLEAEQAPSKARKRCQEGTGSMRSRGGSLRQEVEGRNPKSYPR